MTKLSGDGAVLFVAGRGGAKMSRCVGLFYYAK